MSCWLTQSKEKDDGIHLFRLCSYSPDGTTFTLKAGPMAKQPSTLRRASDEKATEG